MGGGNWSQDFYDNRQRTRVATGATAFTHDQNVRTGKASSALHAQMNPLGVTRESRDSVAHPNSRGVMAFLDVTGSMLRVPVVLQKQLGSLMRLLLDKGLLPDPQILFGAVGDANSDMVPLQVGQFESGVEMDDDLGKLYLEGGGGGQTHESYELALYFAARHTSMDCWEKRGEKGYLFLIGDEKTYKEIKSQFVKEIMGDDLGESITTKDIVTEAQEKFHVFFIIPEDTDNARNRQIGEEWETLLGSENVIRVNTADDVCPAIVSTIGIIEGRLNSQALATTLVSANFNKASADSLSRSLAKVGAGAITTRAKGTLPATKGGKTGGAARL